MTERVRLIAEISGGFTGEDGPDFKDGELPASYEAAMEPYAKRGSKAGKLVCKNLSAFLKASLIPPNFSAWNKVFMSADEVEAIDVTITGFGFDGTTNLPEINAIAVFEVLLKKGVNQNILQEIEDVAGETLGEAVNFYWSFDDNPLKNWDGSLINNSGIDVTLG